MAYLNQSRCYPNAASPYLLSHWKRLSVEPWSASSRLFSGYPWPAQVSAFLLTVPYKHLNSAPGLYTSHWVELHPLESVPWTLLVCAQGHSFSSAQHNSTSWTSVYPNVDTRCAQFTHCMTFFWPRSVVYLTAWHRLLKFTQFAELFWNTY